MTDGPPEGFPGIGEVPPKPRPNPPPEGNGGGRPEIEVRAGEMERVVDQAEAALIGAQALAPVEKRVFRRGDRIVSIAIDKGLDHKGMTAESQIIVEIDEHAIAERLGIAATFQKYDGRLRGGKGGLKKIDPPKAVVLTLMARGYNLKLPVLVGVANSPQLVADGRILDKPGYDPATGIFCDPRETKFPISGETR